MAQHRLRQSAQVSIALSAAIRREEPISWRFR
jgi:hypothetical protein